jgi:muramidase (phage lysozyme)
MARLTPEAAGGRNVLAFLDLIAHAEGVERFSRDDGYDVIVGGTRFTDYRQHPQQRIWLPRYRVYSTAAGRYQFLWRTWNTLRQRLHLPDFGPLSQDRAAIELIREKNALIEIQQGRVVNAIDKVRTLWASLPGAGYGQREVALETLLTVYRQAGGQRT